MPTGETQNCSGVWQGVSGSMAMNCRDFIGAMAVSASPGRVATALVPSVLPSTAEQREWVRSGLIDGVDTRAVFLVCGAADSAWTRASPTSMSRASN